MIRLIVAMAVVGMAGAASAQQGIGEHQGMGLTGSAQPTPSETPMMVRKPCEDLKAEIDAKIKKNGIPAYSLDVVDMDAQAEGKVVGTCDGQTKKIVYKRA